MSAFGDPWGDIDRTPKGTPYIVDASGWGWFGLAILLLIPFIVLAFILVEAAKFVVNHTVLSILMYLIVAILIGLISYHKRGYHWCITGALATVFTFMPVVAVEILIEIPNILQTGDSIGGMIGMLIEWVVVTLIFVGMGILIHAFNMLSVSPKRHLIISFIYCTIIGVILIIYITPEMMEEFWKIYLDLEQR